MQSSARPERCQQCGARLPWEWAGERCPRCAAGLRARRTDPLERSALLPGACGLLAGMPLGGNLLRLLLPTGLEPRHVQLAALVVGIAGAAALIWLSRRLLPAALPGFFRLCTALLLAAFTVLFVGAFSLVIYPAANDPGVLLLGQVGLTAALYLLMSRGRRW